MVSSENLQHRAGVPWRLHRYCGCHPEDPRATTGHAAVLPGPAMNCRRRIRDLPG
jgi:hypothetical protein